MLVWARRLVWKGISDWLAESCFPGIVCFRSYMHKLPVFGICLQNHISLKMGQTRQYKSVFFSWMVVKPAVLVGFHFFDPFWLFAAIAGFCVGGRRRIDFR